MSGIDPADTRDVDGYPGLAPDAAPMAPCEFYDVGGRAVPACPCGDPGDCQGCAS